MKKLLALYFALLVSLSSFSQVLKTPDDFLGYKLGEQFTPHYRVLEYFKYLASASPAIKLQEYGQSNEGRQLIVAFIASAENINRLEDIRHNNLKLTGLEAGAANMDEPVIVWLSYNVHGNEAASTEASMKTLYALADPENAQAKSWLRNTVVIIDPCLNPDGRERYVNFYNSVRGEVPNSDPSAREHQEPWPEGRSNHYYFDLNRDWAWQTQAETIQRLALYNQWMPEIHVDYHEQDYNQPYYFAPAAEPVHQNVTRWQRDFQVVIGKNHARYFDKNGWMYFTRERFDLLYPSYGDTYPIYNGAIGMTYEQGGIAAGISIVTQTGDTLTLKERIEHHYITGLSTVEVASHNAAKLISEFKTYFSASKNTPPGKYKAFVVKNDNSEKIKTLITLLERNHIDFGYGGARDVRGFNYFSGKTEHFNIGRNDLVLSAYQPKSVLLNVLFEPRTFMSDSVTYDITAWSLPYAYGLQAYATTAVLKPLSKTLPVTDTVPANVKDPIAFVANWNSMADVKFLCALLDKNIKVRYSEASFQAGGKTFNAGSLIIAKTSNQNMGDGFYKTIERVAQSAGVNLQGISSGLADKGPDLGSPSIHFIKKPTIAIVIGEDAASLAFGEVWQFFEQQLRFPVTVVRSKDLLRSDLKWDILILPDGSYRDTGDGQLLQWIRKGGKLIAIGDAVSNLAGKRGYSIKSKIPDEGSIRNTAPYSSIKLYQDREREDVRTGIPGAIYKVDLDNTHPLAFGFPKFYYTMKLNDRLYKFLDNGWNVGVLRNNNYVSGFVGTAVLKKLNDGLVFGNEEIGLGNAVYLADDPLFRGFWENGKLLFSNAVFMVGQ